LSERLLTAPTFEQFMRHAELFGIECVFETAAEYLPVVEMDRLRIELDAIERERRHGRFTVGKNRRRSETETVRYAVALAQELAEAGLSSRAIGNKVADKLGLSDAYARRVLKPGGEMVGTSQIAPRKPFVQAKKSATKRESDSAAPLELRSA
jgi:hypothetical protein